MLKKLKTTTPQCIEINKLKVYGVLGVSLVLIFYTYYIFTKFKNESIVIDNADMLKAHMKGYSSNLISDSRGNLYKIASNPLLLHFKSAEILNTVKPGGKFFVSGYGKRIAFLGLYPIITKIRKTTI